MAGEYSPSERPAGPDCTDRAAYGAASALDQYITKQYLLAEEDYPKDACPQAALSTQSGPSGLLPGSNSPAITLSPQCF